MYRMFTGIVIVDQVVSILLFEKMTEESSQYLNSIIDNLEILDNNLPIIKAKHFWS